MTAIPESNLPIVTITYDPVRLLGRFSFTLGATSSIWERIKARVIADPLGRVSDLQLELPWHAALGVLRDFGSKQQQVALGFRFKLEGEAERLVKQFAKEYQEAQAAKKNLILSIEAEDIQPALERLGFVRKLRTFQIRDLQRLLSLPHGANFSVPGAGKTTVTLALNLLISRPHHFFVVSPKSAFPAWMSVINECMEAKSNIQPPKIILLDGDEANNFEVLMSGNKHFLISYDLMIRQQAMLFNYFSRHQVHLVLDESHRMKAGIESQRGAFLISIAPFLMRRDILTGTPMPQGPHDMASQLSFLWPGHGLDLKIQRGQTPRNVLGQLYVRTTKSELGLPKAKRVFHDVPMSPGQQALYGIIRNESLRKLSTVLGDDKNSINFLKARKSVMRLLQLSSNPILAIRAISEDFPGIRSGVIDTVLEEGPSLKMRAVADMARNLATNGKKTVIWTIFIETIKDLEAMLADLNPVSLYGAIPSGLPNDLNTREGRLAKFHNDSECKVLIANPAAAGEGISLHTVCHDAIYLDRSYVSTHYLQSIDRVHRLGLNPGTQTTINIFRTKAPLGLGSIDYSVSRRLIKKIKSLQELLDDKDLHEIAFDEENADDPIDYSVELQDIVDLVEELEGKYESSEDDEI